MALNVCVKRQGKSKAAGSPLEFPKHHDPRIIPQAVLSPAANLEASTPLRRRSSKEKMDPMTTGDFGANGPADEEPSKIVERLTVSREVMGIPLKQ